MLRIKNVRECFILFALLMPVARADESVGKGDAARKRHQTTHTPMPSQVTSCSGVILAAS